MAKDELIDSKVSLKQCRLAVEALHSHESKRLEKLQETELLPGKEQNIWLNVTVKKIPSGHKFKPIKIPIIHPLVDPRTTPVCLITKDPQRQYKDLLESHEIKFISRVVGVEKLKGKFKPFEARRALLKENGLFLADERVIPLLPKLLGTKWFEAKKQPIPVCLTRKDLKGELERAISSTYMNQNQGTCTSIKVSTLSHKPAQVLANIQSAIPAVVKHIKGGWDNVQSFNIKTNSSVSLPIWSCRLDGEEGGRWDGFAAEDEQSDDEDKEKDSGEEEEMEVDDDSTKTKKGAKKSGLKRATSSDEEEEEEKPRKKSKGVKGTPVAVPPTSKEKSTSKSTIPSPIAAPSSAKTTKAAAAHVDTPAKSKKRTAAAAPSTPEIKDATTPATTDDLLSTKKAKKSKTDTVSAAKPLPSAEPLAKIAPTSELTSVAGDKKKKKKVAATVNVEPSPSSVEAIPKKKERKGTSPLEAPPTPSVPIASEEKSVKEKKKAKPDQADPAPAKTTEIAAVSAVTKEEHKQKRSGGAGEKKKEKVAKLKGGKSAKDALLGKKAGQSL